MFDKNTVIEWIAVIVASSSIFMVAVIAGMAITELLTGA